MVGILAIVIILIVLFVAGAGYFSYSGDMIVDRQDDQDSATLKPEENITLSQQEDFNKGDIFVDKCKEIVCENSTVICPDTFKSSCSNSCKDGVCGNCAPGCKGHELVASVQKTNYSSPPLNQSTPSPVLKSTPDVPAPIPTSGSTQQEIQPLPNTPEPTQTPQTQTKQPKIINIKFDADGDDRMKVNWNTEWVEIDGQGIDVSGWTLQDNSTHKFTFPEGFTIGGLIKVRSGYGNNTQTDLYFGDGPIWNNNGDVAYLKDKDGNLVDQYSYEGL